MSPLPTLQSDPDNIPDDPRDLTPEIYRELAADLQTLTRYVRINHARCAIDSPPEPTP